jgi:hypothetical protein
MANKIPLDFEKLKKDGMKISILVDNPLPQYIGEGKESYVGLISSFTDDFLVLALPDSKRLYAIVIKWEMIVSLWIYR